MRGMNLNVYFNHAWRHMTACHGPNKSYEGESISNQPNLFPVEIHLFFFDVIAL